MANPVDYIRRHHEALTAIRRDLHMPPALAFEESRTSDIVARELSALGIEVHRGLATTGVVGVIPGRVDTQGRKIGLRADMDCLPMHESDDRPHASRTPVDTMATPPCCLGRPAT